jgi:hypothetical protein
MNILNVALGAEILNLVGVLGHYPPPREGPRLNLDLIELMLAIRLGVSSKRKRLRSNLILSLVFIALSFYM